MTPSEYVKLGLSAVIGLACFFLTLSDNADKGVSQQLIYALIGGAIGFAVVWFGIDFLTGKTGGRRDRRRR